MNPVHTFPTYFCKIQSNIILPSTPMSSERSLPFRFSDRKFLRIYEVSCACCTHRSSHLSGRPLRCKQTAFKSAEKCCHVAAPCVVCLLQRPESGNEPPAFQLTGRFAIGTCYIHSTALRDVTFVTRQEMWS
jgi:hypothetical protein